MIKKLLLFFVFFILMLASVNMSYAANITLEQIADAFNNSLSTKEYNTSNSRFFATVEGNVLDITLEVNDSITSNSEYQLEGNILSLKKEGTSEIVVRPILIDSIGQLHGYSDGDLFPTLRSTEVLNYTLENEGLKISTGVTKIDLTKKIPLLDFSNVYIKVSDLQNESRKEILTGDGGLQYFEGDVTLVKNGYGNEITIEIQERRNLTDNAYKSILSALQVVFDSEKVPNYFKENYSNFSVGNKEFNGFKVELETVGEITPSVTITVDKSAVRSHLGILEETNNNINEEENSSNNTINNTWDDEQQATVNQWEMNAYEEAIKLNQVYTNLTAVIENYEKNKDNTTKLDISNNGNTLENTNSIADLDILPRTGKDIDKIIIVLYVIIGVSIFGAIYMSKRNKR